MRRVLITGMSGTGKSAVIQELTARGHRAYDLDTADWSEWIEADASDRLTPSPGKDWVWREKRVRQLLSVSGSGRLFVSGCAENMTQFFPMIDVVILLRTSIETLMERLAARPSGRYGHTAEDRAKVTDLIATVEPRLRVRAHVEIDTGRPVRETADLVLRSA